MKKKFFVISDIHGGFEYMIKALEKAGYDENNPKHFLIVLGDLFDRLYESVSVYEYLYKLNIQSKAIILRGNHEGMFQKYLSGESIDPFNYYNNGTRETIADFLERTAPFESWYMIDKGIKKPTYQDFADWCKIMRENINRNYPELLKWIESLPYYYESKNYIFTHASIDGICNDWHYPQKELYYFQGWEACIWDDGSFFGSSIVNTNKKVVIGHFGTDHLRKKYKLKENFSGYDNSILIRNDEKIIAIDSTVVASHEINVFVIEDELL